MTTVAAVLRIARKQDEGPQAECVLRDTARHYFYTEDDMQIAFISAERIVSIGKFKARNRLFILFLDQ